MIWLMKVRELKQGYQFHCSGTVTARRTGRLRSKSPLSCTLVGNPGAVLGVGKREWGSIRGSEQSSKVAGQELGRSGHSCQFYNSKKQTSSFASTPLAVFLLRPHRPLRD